MGNQNHNLHNHNWLSLAGLVLLFIPVSIWIVWIGTFSANPEASRSEKVAIFLSYFPPFLSSISSTSLMVIISAAGSIIFTILGRKSANRLFRVAGIFVIILASFVLLLQLFSMM